MPDPARRFAVIDPQWGDAQVMASTISDTEQGAIDKALMDPDHSIWSGAALHVIPPRPGKWANLVAQGYTVQDITA